MRRDYLNRLDLLGEEEVMLVCWKCWIRRLVISVLSIGSRARTLYQVTARLSYGQCSSAGRTSAPA